jgi:hypothetical protein
VPLDGPLDPPFVKALKREHLMFKFVNKYVNEAELPDTVTQLNFNDYTDFLTFIDANGLEYKTDSEKKIEELKSTSEEEGLPDSFAEDIDALLSKIEVEKKNDTEE